ncbi:hypothetical protein A7U60_g3031 [Sanghuangporus baumii]|uniref:Uncharacterized protein n=1 Tax=Sanghuangporus baumii TaxID=108892 RepID=A0A9Q5I155_SANBA|nr:hypothetical protein A7U60_g3031 [Sanghuangporus baumii]
MDRFSHQWLAFMALLTRTRHSGCTSTLQNGHFSEDLSRTLKLPNSDRDLHGLRSYLLRAAALFQDFVKKKKVLFVCSAALFFVVTVLSVSFYHTNPSIIRSQEFPVPS